MQIAPMLTTSHAKNGLRYENATPRPDSGESSGLRQKAKRGNWLQGSQLLDESAKRQVLPKTIVFADLHNSDMFVSFRIWPDRGQHCSESEQPWPTSKRICPISAKFD